MKNIRFIFICIATCYSVCAAAQNPDLMKQMKLQLQENDPAKSTAMMKKIIKENKLQDKKDAETIDMMKGNIAMDYLEAGMYAEFDKTISSMRNKFNQTSFMNMAATTLVQKNKDLQKAEAIAKKTLDLYFSYKDDPKAKPEEYSQEDWSRFMTFAYYPYCDTYAAALHAVGKYKEALEYQEKSINGAPEEAMPTSVELYAKLLVLNNQEEKAYQLLLKMAETGKSTEGMNKLLKELYVKKNSDAGFDAFFAGLQKNVVAKLKEEFKKKMQDIDAPAFELKDLEGKTVSLSDFKGKIVVIDFWATWCAPCKASFPAMKKTVEQHPEVKFLFIATQEKQEGATERVRKYITDNKYPFHVLMDEPLVDKPQMFEALSAYKPQGIPAKIVIDPRGKQRFLTTGFSSDTELINEMEAMIQLAAEQG